MISSKTTLKTPDTGLCKVIVYIIIIYTDAIQTFFSRKEGGWRRKGKKGALLLSTLVFSCHVVQTFALVVATIIEFLTLKEQLTFVHTTWNERMVFKL